MLMPWLRNVCRVKWQYCLATWNAFFLCPCGFLGAEDDAADDTVGHCRMSKDAMMLLVVLEVALQVEPQDQA